MDALPYPHESMRLVLLIFLVFSSDILELDKPLVPFLSHDGQQQATGTVSKLLRVHGQAGHRMRISPLLQGSDLQPADPRFLLGIAWHLLPRRHYKGKKSLEMCSLV